MAGDNGLRVSREMNLTWLRAKIQTLSISGQFLANVMTWSIRSAA
jgi:hypothetical protein